MKVYPPCHHRSHSHNRIKEPNTSNQARSQMPKKDKRIGTRCLALEEDGEGAEQRRPMWSPRMSPEKDACGCTTPCNSTTAHSGHDESPHPHRTRISISAASPKTGCKCKQAQTRRNRKGGKTRDLSARCRLAPNCCLLSRLPPLVFCLVGANAREKKRQWVPFQNKKIMTSLLLGDHFV